MLFGEREEFVLECELLQTSQWQKEDVHPLCPVLLVSQLKLIISEAKMIECLPG